MIDWYVRIGEDQLDAEKNPDVVIVPYDAGYSREELDRIANAPDRRIATARDFAATVCVVTIILAAVVAFVCGRMRHPAVLAVVGAGLIVAWGPRPLALYLRSRTRRPPASPAPRRFTGRTASRKTVSGPSATLRKLDLDTGAITTLVDSAATGWCFTADASLLATYQSGIVRVLETATATVLAEYIPPPEIRRDPLDLPSGAPLFVGHKFIGIPTALESDPSRLGVRVASLDGSFPEHIVQGESLDDRWVGAASFDATVMAIGNGSEPLSFYRPGQETPISKARRANLASLTFSPDGSRIAGCGGSGGIGGISITDVRSGSRLPDPAYNGVLAVAWSRCGDRLGFVGSPRLAGPVEDTRSFSIRVWNCPRASEEWATRYSSAGWGDATSMAFGPDDTVHVCLGRWRRDISHHVSGSEKNTSNLLRFDKRGQLQSETRIAAYVTAMALSPDGRAVYLAGFPAGSGT